MPDPQATKWQNIETKPKTPIASCAVFGGFTGKRVGTHYFYTEQEIKDYPHELRYFRRRNVKG